MPVLASPSNIHTMASVRAVGFFSPLFLFQFQWGDTLYTIRRIVKILA